MNKVSIFLFGLLVACFSSMISGPTLQADCSTLQDPATDSSGIFRFQLIPSFCECGTVFSVLGEVGPENYRANVTFASENFSNFRYKIGAEYLTQEHNYRFSNSSSKEWVHQAAVGGAIQALFPRSCFQALELGADYSHAWGKNLSDVECESNTLERKLSDSDAFNIRLGSVISTPCNGYFTGWIEYDYVEYNRDLRDNKTVQGVGAGFLLDQPIKDNLGVKLIADFKRPYQFYEAQLNWGGYARDGAWQVGAFTNYTNGRCGLNNDFKFGGQLTYRFGKRVNCCRPNRCAPIQSFDRWVAIPAVYRPMVLSIPDQTLSDCIPPAVVGNPPIDLLLNSLSPSFSFDFSVYFSGTNLVYSADNLPDNLTMDPATGIISGAFPEEGEFIVTISATNECGEASFEVLFDVQGPI